jgi:hypothetical protein
MTYFCRISIFAVKNTRKYLVFDPLKNTRMPYVRTMRLSHHYKDAVCTQSALGAKEITRVSFEVKAVVRALQVRSAGRERQRGLRQPWARGARRVAVWQPWGAPRVARTRLVSGVAGAIGMLASCFSGGA